MLEALKSYCEQFLDVLFIRLPLRFLKRNVIRDIGLQSSLKKRALVYFKTDPYFSRRLSKAYIHTNNSEILAMVEVFNRLGFLVDLVDRDAEWFEIEPLLSNRYNVYLANAAGNSAPWHREINSRIVADRRIFFAAGPEPETSNRLVEARHDEFDHRSGETCTRRRLVEDDKLAERFEHMDAVFYVGNRFSEGTYARRGLPTSRIYPSTSPRLRFDEDALMAKRSTNFMYFGGNGLICKGLDVVLEAFDGLEGVTLDVCGPTSEADFWQYYRPLLARNSHIRFHGFVKAGSEKFSTITAAAAFQVFPGSAEGCATSVVTCMRRGVIPVTTYETGVDMGDFGFTISDASVEGIRNQVMRLKNLDAEEMRKRVVDTYLASMEYTPECFVRSFEAALLKTCH